jgi:hypothetical protein
MNTTPKLKKSSLTTIAALFIPQLILWGSAIVASAITLQGDTHTSQIMLILSYSGGMSLFILFLTAINIAKKGKNDHDA